MNYCRPYAAHVTYRDTNQAKKLKCDQETVNQKDCLNPKEKRDQCMHEFFTLKGHGIGKPRVARTQDQTDTISRPGGAG